MNIGQRLSDVTGLVVSDDDLRFVSGNVPVSMARRRLALLGYDWNAMVEACSRAVVSVEVIEESGPAHVPTKIRRFVTTTKVVWPNGDAEEWKTAGSWVEVQ